MQDGLMFTFGFIILACYVYFMLTTKAQQEKIEHDIALDKKNELKKDQEEPLT